MNKVFLIGNLGKDVDYKTLNSGHTVAKFSLATTTYIAKDKSKTEWHNITCWGKLADVCATYLKKGSKVMIEGSIEYQKYKNKEGVDVYATQINASSVEFLDRKEKKDETESVVIPEVDYTQDIPF